MFPIVQLCRIIERRIKSRGFLLEQLGLERLQSGNGVAGRHLAINWTPVAASQQSFLPAQYEVEPLLPQVAKQQINTAASEGDEVANS